MEFTVMVRLKGLAHEPRAQISGIFEESSDWPTSVVDPSSRELLAGQIHDAHLTGDATSGFEPTVLWSSRFAPAARPGYFAQAMAGSKAEQRAYIHNLVAMLKKQDGFTMEIRGNNHILNTVHERCVGNLGLLRLDFPEWAADV
jgi:hypothetical protein